MPLWLSSRCPAAVACLSLRDPRLFRRGGAADGGGEGGGDDVEDEEDEEDDDDDEAVGRRGRVVVGFLGSSSS